MNNIDIESIIRTAAQAVDLVLAMQRSGQLKPKTKSNITDIVTEADLASEKLIRAALYDLDPAIGFMGEESDHTPQEESFWIVDPIDGTVNFAHGIPYAAVNIALYQAGQVALGVTAQFPYRRIFWAKRGQGSFVREPDGSQSRLILHRAETLQHAFLATGFPYHSGEHEDNNLSEINDIAKRCLGLRVFGAAALDTAHVASGGVAGFWEGWVNPWDVAPGTLLIEEAGGKVTGYDGKPWHLHSPGYVGSNGKIHDELLDCIQQVRSTLKAKRLPV